MNMRRRVGLLAAALLIPALAACGSDATDGSGDAKKEAAIPADPKQALVEATKVLESGDFRYTLTGDQVKGEGAVHMPSNSAHISMTIGDAAQGFAMEMEYIFLGEEGWIRLDIQGLGADANPTAGKFHHVDTKKVPDSSSMILKKGEADPVGSKALMNSIVEVQKTGEGAYSGTIDVTKAGEMQLVDKDTIEALGDQATKLPFTAKIDDQGRLVEFGMQMPAAGDLPAQDIKMVYSDFGSVTGIQAPPAADVVEADEEFYQKLA
ncbi:hypothetical protein [Melissospora conviva]|uniref:hypothetical protein n=1 Tax=Melissospora conviva TaxID=3388432 RepID=UPI003C193FDE